MEQEVRKGRPEPNYGALYRKAVEEGWHATLVAQEDAKRDVARRRKVTERALQAKAAEDEERNAAYAARIASAFLAFDALPEEKKDDIRESFRSTLTVVAMRKSFDKQGEQAPIVRSQFAEYFLSLNQRSQPRAGSR